MQEEIRDAEFYKPRNEAPTIQATEYKEFIHAENELIGIQQAAKKCNYGSSKTITVWEAKEGLPIKKASTDKSHCLLRVVEVKWLRGALKKRGKDYTWIDQKDYEPVIPKDGKLEITKAKGEAVEAPISIHQVRPNAILASILKQNKKINRVFIACAILFSTILIFAAMNFQFNRALVLRNKHLSENITELNIQLYQIKINLNLNDKKQAGMLRDLIAKTETAIEENKKKQTPYLYFWER